MQKKNGKMPGWHIRSGADAISNDNGNGNAFSRKIHPSKEQVQQQLYIYQGYPRKK